MNFCRCKLGFTYWSLTSFHKYKVKNSVQYINNFEQAVAQEAEERGVSGVVCGHIHWAEITKINGIAFYNCGDWVESCTALVEHPIGEIEMIKWTDSDNQLKNILQFEAA